MRNDYTEFVAEYKKLSLMREDIIKIIDDYKAQVSKDLPNLSDCERKALKRTAVPLIKIKKLLEG